MSMLESLIFKYISFVTVGLGILSLVVFILLVNIIDRFLNKFNIGDFVSYFVSVIISSFVSVLFFILAKGLLLSLVFWFIIFITIIVLIVLRYLRVI